jgi:hypothetical protein
VEGGKTPFSFAVEETRTLETSLKSFSLIRKTSKTVIIFGSLLINFKECYIFGVTFSLAKLSSKLESNHPGTKRILKTRGKLSGELPCVSRIVALKIKVLI